jgi:hypothetical protein
VKAVETMETAVETVVTHTRVGVRVVETERVMGILCSTAGTADDRQSSQDSHDEVHYGPFGLGRADEQSYSGSALLPPVRGQT